MSDSPITCSVDLNQPGRNLGVIRVPHSVHRSAYGHIPVPVASIVGEKPGPSVLLMAGNHGDEYEGQIILSELIRSIDPAQVSGKLVMLPMANFAAAEAGLRTSPLDSGNLNRSFPGVPLGQPTEMTAYYIEHVLMPGVDVFIDLHSGGSSLYCLPFAMTMAEDGDKYADLRRAILYALGLPVVLWHGSEKSGWYSTSAAARAGAVGFTLELGGGGTVDPKIRQGAQAGVLRALAAIGLYDANLPTLRLAGKLREFFAEDLIYADEAGLYEPLAVSGEDVEAGQPAARIHFPDRPGREPVAVAFTRPGTIVAHRVPARVLRGDCLFHMVYPE